MTFHRYLLYVLVVVLSACMGAAPPEPSIRPGIDVLVSDSLHLVQHSRVGLVTNQTGIGRDGTQDVEILLAAEVNLTALFSPEHGFRGVLDQPNVDHDVDSATGLPIYSLYGDTRSPTAEMLERVDVLVVDLQDIGARPYTYISTTLLAMRSASDAGKPVIVLDRPNPIGGTQVQGPMLDSGLTSFVGMMSVPLRHGMTLGELARLGNHHLGIDAELTVVPAAGWRREVWFDETGLPWIRPSPNMPDLESATHYPGTVIFEATNLSVGRGTPIAFQVIGAPWLDPHAVIDRLPPLDGVAIGDTVVTPVAPTDRKYDGMALNAIRLRVTSRTEYDPTKTALAIMSAVRAVHPDSLEIRAPSLDQRLGQAALREGLEAGSAPARLWSGWPAESAEFRRLRAPFLLY